MKLNIEQLEKLTQDLDTFYTGITQSENTYRYLWTKEKDILRTIEQGNTLVILIKSCLPICLYGKPIRKYHEMRDNIIAQLVRIDDLGQV